MNRQNIDSCKQIIFPFAVNTQMGTDDFMVSDCNKEAWQMVNNLPQWVENGLFIYGPQGCGKTHLAHIFADNVKKISVKPAAVAIVDASQVTAAKVKRLAAENQAIAVENIGPQNNNEALFHLFNLFNQDGKYMLWTAEYAPQHMHFALADLQSRLNMLPAVVIKEPDDMMIRMLTAKLLNDRQIIANQEILDYITTYAQRSFSYIRELIEEADAISLRMKMPINHVVIKKAMENIDERIDREPDLFGEW